jgi:hypothetical protein
VSAPQYYNFLTEWITKQLDNEAIFPTEGLILSFYPLFHFKKKKEEEMKRIKTILSLGEFPKDFVEHVNKILKRMFRVYAHIYNHHWEVIQRADASNHFCVCFKHFYFFIKEFDLVERADLVPMKDMTDRFDKEE